ncbi:lipoprotein [Escherichia coli]|nr:lipoprotein [Escherichia coli]
MKKWKVRSALVALVVLLAGCSSNAQYNSSASGNVGTAWGGGMYTHRFRAYLLNESGAIRQR